MSQSRHAGVYAALLRLYPRRFREEYGTDMVLLLREQLRDERAARVIARTAIDLVISLPTRHLEAHVTRPPNAIVSVLFAAVSVAGLVAAAVLGTSRGAVGVALPVAAAAGAIAIVAWRRSQPVASAASAGRWWKLLITGVAIMATLIGVTTVTGEVPGDLYWPTMFAGLTGIVLIAAGAILGLARLASNGQRTTAA